MFRTLDRVAPAVAGRLAARLWCTPPRPRHGAAGSLVPGGARHTVPVHGRPVAVETWGPGAGGAAGQPHAVQPLGGRAGRGTVYLVHGWGGWRGQLDPFVAPLVAAGFRVVSFDALAHGQSARGNHGRLSTLPEMADTFAAVVRACGPATGVVAHSLGGSATALAVLDGLDVGRLVLIAPVPNPPAYTADFARVLGVGERVHARMVARIERMVGRPIADFDLPGRLRTAAGLPPLLLIHDRDDKESRYVDVPDLAADWPDGELITTHGLGHRRILRDPYVVDQAVTYLTFPGHTTSDGRPL